jgi:protein tyrosine/serine phosphatase
VKSSSKLPPIMHELRSMLLPSAPNSKYTIHCEGKTPLDNFFYYKPANTMASLTSPPWVAVAGIQNFRDLGGYSISSSPSTHSIRRGVVYRCGEPTKVTDDGVSTLQSLGIKHVYDLRSKNEIENNKKAGFGGIKEWNGCERVFAPVFLEQDYSPENIAIRFKDYASDGTEVLASGCLAVFINYILKNIQGFTRAYRDILRNAPPSYRQILLHLANDPDKPLLVHCTAGKDRTGVLCALILSLCGVDDETVAYEYSLTDIGLADFKTFLIEHLMVNPALNGDRQGAMNMISSKLVHPSSFGVGTNSSERAVNMLSTLKMIREEFGGPEGYMIEKCGLSKDDVQKIRTNIIVATPAIHTEVPKI